MSDMEEILVDGLVTYPLQIDGKFYLIENVPARIDEETGEHYFSAVVVENLQQIVSSGKEPDRTIETTVYNYENHRNDLQKS
jgi:hypothetical protein